MPPRQSLKSDKASCNALASKGQRRKTNEQRTSVVSNLSELFFEAENTEKSSNAISQDDARPKILPKPKAKAVSKDSRPFPSSGGHHPGEHGEVFVLESTSLPCMSLYDSPVVLPQCVPTIGIAPTSIWSPESAASANQNVFAEGRHEYSNSSRRRPRNNDEMHPVSKRGSKVKQNCETKQIQLRKTRPQLEKRLEAVRIVANADTTRDSTALDSASSLVVTGSIEGFDLDTEIPDGSNVNVNKIGVDDVFTLGEHNPIAPVRRSRKRVLRGSQLKRTSDAQVLNELVTTDLMDSPLDTTKAEQSSDDVLAIIGNMQAVVTADEGIDVNSVLASRDFNDWIHAVAKVSRLVIHEIRIQAVNVIGRSIESIKISADTRLGGKDVSDIVFLRGGSIAILTILIHAGKQFTLIARQARVPACSSNLAEIPLGTFDEDGFFVGAAANEIKKELGIHIDERELVDMTRLGFNSMYSGIYPSCDRSYEFNRIYLFQKVVNAQQLATLHGNLTGVMNEGETMKLEIIPLKELWRVSPDAKALAALCLYKKLSEAGLIPHGMNHGMNETMIEQGRGQKNCEPANVGTAMTKPKRYHSLHDMREKLQMKEEELEKQIKATETMKANYETRIHGLEQQLHHLKTQLQQSPQDSANIRGLKFSGFYTIVQSIPSYVVRVQASLTKLRGQDRYH